MVWFLSQQQPHQICPISTCMWYYIFTQNVKTPDVSRDVQSRVVTLGSNKHTFLLFGPSDLFFLQKENTFFTTICFKMDLLLQKLDLINLIRAQEATFCLLKKHEKATISKYELLHLCR